MKKFLLIICLLLPVFIYAQKKKKAGPSTYDLLIGTYTNGQSKGIYVYRFYVETGKLAYLNEIDDINNPSYLCVSANNKFVYSVNENGKNGLVSAFTFDPKQGKLVLINSQLSGGGGPCYVSVDKDQKNVFAANYGTGSLAVFPVNKDGSLSPASQVIQDQGQGVNKERQEGPHVHTAVLSPDEKYLLYTDLGTDKLNIMRYKASHPQPLMLLMRRFVLLCCAKSFEVALAVEIGFGAAMHQAEVGEGFGTADALVEQEAEIFVELRWRDAGEVEGAGGEARLEALLEGSAFGGGFLGALLERFGLDDSDFCVASAVDLILGEQGDEAAGLGGGEVAEAHGAERECGTIGQRRERMML